MKFIAQYRAHIMGTHIGETIDFIELTSNNYAVFKRRDDYEFELILIDRCEYNDKDFNKVLTDPSCYWKESLLHMWRSEIVKDPQFMDPRYYMDILKVNTKYLDLNDIHVKRINIVLDSAREAFNKEGFGLVIAKNRGF